MAATTTLTGSEAGVRSAVPRLENGDRLTRAEFERRYLGMPGLKKAELIEGIVHMPSPVSRLHATAHGDLITWLGTYRAATPGTEIADNATVRLDLENEAQPDVLLRVLPRAGGQTRDTSDDYVEGAPELVAEIASSSASYDLHEKKRAYRRNGVREYLVWLVNEQRVEWWEWREGEYVSLAAERGVIRSRLFPGLWLEVAALVAGRSADVLAGLKRGLASEEHAAFASQLGARLR